MREDPLSQETLTAILTRALDPERTPKPEDQPVFSIQRTLFPDSRATSSREVHSNVHIETDENVLELGTLVSIRTVSSFDLRLVHAPQEDAWRIIVSRSRGKGVVILTYSSQETATQYAEEASEIDLSWDFEPTAHFFGECRGTRETKP